MKLIELLATLPKSVLDIKKPDGSEYDNVYFAQDKFGGRVWAYRNCPYIGDEDLGWSASYDRSIIDWEPVSRNLKLADDWATSVVTLKQVLAYKQKQYNDKTKELLLELDKLASVVTLTPRLQYLISAVKSEI